MDDLITIREYLSQAVLKKEDVDRFLDRKEPNWAEFDPMLGYRLRDSVSRDGMDSSFTIGRYGKHGERKMSQFTDRPCRINTYGNSFTMCHQVSDGETWQEHLAAHFWEPIRNFGVGGYGVYQAYRRMLAVEEGPAAAPNVILNVWGIDDHYRNLDAWRALRHVDFFKNPASRNMFHANPWVYVKIAPATGGLTECESICPTPDSLYNLCCETWVYETFKDDIALHMFLGSSRPDVEIDTKPMEQLANTLGLKLDLKSAESRPRAVGELYKACALKSTMHIIDKAQAFADKRNKKLLVLLSYAHGHIVAACAGRSRPDQPFVDFLNGRGTSYVDIIPKHVEDFKQFNLSLTDYANRYFIGHYSPKGNHFYAFAIKDALVEWLKPTPAPYRKGGVSIKELLSSERGVT